jgi:hypothetical protein
MEHLDQGIGPAPLVEHDLADALAVKTFGLHTNPAPLFVLATGKAAGPCRVRFAG